MEDRVHNKETVYSVAKAFSQASGISFNLANVLLWKHMKEGHDTPEFKELEAEEVLEPLKTEEYDFEGAAKKLLEEGMAGREGMKAKEKLEMAGKLESINIKNKQTEIQSSALKLTAAKFFGGFLKGEEGEDGEKPKQITGIITEDSD
jgi:formate dehydrogenase maturation protein FdhE